jgi:juvenile hormone-III synthase
MNNAKLYKKSNTQQKRDAQDIMSEFAHVFEAVSGEVDQSLLDVGCGAGDVLAEIILPKLSSKFIKVIGVDISPEMIKYASDQYRGKYLRFLKVDIESDFLSIKSQKISQTIVGQQQQQQLQPESFSFITSFYCLHWIQNQR